jgi:hypothetical protein
MAVAFVILFIAAVSAWVASSVAVSIAELRRTFRSQ